MFFNRYGVAVKIRLVLLLIILSLSLSACADVDISYRLSDDNSLNINYSLSLSSVGEDISGNISLIKAYWADMGFSVDDSENNGVFSLNGNKAISCDSQGSAALELSSILTDKDSLFSDVAFTYTPSYFEDDYDLSANISLKDIVRKSKESNIPSAEIESFLKDAENGKYTLSITLPGKVLKTNADTQDGQTCTWLLKYGEARKLELKTKRVFDENAAHYASLNETQSNDNLLFIISCAAAGLLLFLIIIVLSVRRARAKRPVRSKINAERF